MEPVRKPVDSGLLLSELSADKLIKRTNRDGNEIYEIIASDCPNVMQEIGRIRELAFRKAGSGTGKSADIDALDTGAVPYKQLIIWDPAQKIILGGYRYKEGWNAEKSNEQYILGTARLFEYSELFISEFLPHTIELGRSFIHPDFQTTGDSKKIMFVMDNLWNGLGSLITRFPQLKYFIGQVSLYKSFDPLARDLIMYFFEKHCEQPDWLIRAKSPLSYHHSKETVANILNASDRDNDLKILSREVRLRGETIPPMMNTYLNISPSLQSFGTVDNPYFENMEDTGIMITIGDIYASKKDRHL